ncbi:MAG: winged helix-turn-helix domain-containing protein [Woeseiaceae bacterium]|nr:winged helix-turn-helix domain-containing protein [Woeseiaceae bacterium]
MASILVVDPDTPDRNAVVRELRELGHDVTESTSAGRALQVLRSHRPDLLLLEWTLADLAGIEVLADIRRSDEIAPTRVVMTSRRGRQSDVVDALHSGADDIVVKPYAMEELIARVDACLRRPATTHTAGALRAGGIRIDNLSHQVFVDGDSVSLAPREYRLLLFLIANRDRVFSRSQLLAHVWDRSSGVGVRTVDVHVRRLRSILEPYGYDRFLQTVRGSGYRFSPGD